MTFWLRRCCTLRAVRCLTYRGKFTSVFSYPEHAHLHRRATATRKPQMSQGFERAIGYLIDPPTLFAPVDEQRRFIAENSANPHSDMVEAVAQIRDVWPKGWNGARSGPRRRQIKPRARPAEGCAARPSPAARSPCWRPGQRCPAGDLPGKRPCVDVVGDTREPAPQHNRGRQHAFLLDGCADRGGGVSDDVHLRQVAPLVGRNKPHAGLA